MIEKCELCKHETKRNEDWPCCVCALRVTKRPKTKFEPKDDFYEGNKTIWDGPIAR